MSIASSSMMSEKIEILADALSKAQASIINVSKDKEAKAFGKFAGYKYADLASCLEAIKKPLADNGLAITHLLTKEQDEHVLITILTHKSGQWMRSNFYFDPITPSSNNLQQRGAAITYARRYALSAIIGLGQEDDDAQSLNKAETKSQELAPAKESIKTLIDLCASHELDIKSFTTFHKINSRDTESVMAGIANFEKLKQGYLNANI